MSLNSLPSNWPRTFSVLGLGSASVLLIFLWSDRSNGTSSFSDLLDSLLGQDRASPTVAILFFGMMSYLVGQVVMLGGIQTIGKRAKTRLMKLDAKVAFSSNALLAASIKSKTETAELIFACSFLLLAITLWFGGLELVNGNVSGPVVVFLATGIFAWVMKSVAFDFVHDAECELEFFESLGSPEQLEGQ